MKKIRYCRVQLEDELKSYEINALRGAVADAVSKAIGRENEESILFHNHVPEKKYNQGYPLIQYKRIKNKPTIIFLEAAVDVAHHFFANAPTNLKIHTHLISTEIAELVLKQPTLQVWDSMFTYKILDYAAIREKNKVQFDSLDNLKDKIIFLEKMLISHIVAFALNIGWAINEQKRVEVSILDILKHKTIPFKEIDWDAFDLVFKTNVSLPNFIGLGNHVSVGWGVIKNIQPENEW
ncbi:MAG: hypothetical protein EAZ85_02835 [Bacteroidetes bacterium]|nr:MAG: hypothetical protein EAZ85_02835 [Bacteroidota bacterium]TAG92382.1 MAG: hypothetical protein EAZ20_02570 [Bacteroidota bacterium]